MAVDGSLKFDTKIDSSGFESGVKKMSGLAAKGLAAIGTTLAGASAYAIKVGADFEEGMSKVAASSGTSGKELEALTEKAKEMGAKTKFSATESAEAMQYMAMAGWKSADMISGIDGIMNLAAASGEDLASVSDIVTDALTAFGLQAKDSAHFADVLAAASSNSNTNVSMMGATFKYAAPLAGALKYSVEDVATAIGLMANAGIKGEQAGTSLRSMFTRLAKPPKECAEAMDTLGISIKNSDGSAKPLNQTLQDMRQKFSKLSDTQKTQYASAIAGTEAMSGLLAIVNASDTDFNKLAKAIFSADGSAEKMAKTMNDNLKGKVTILGSSLEGLGIQAYEKFEKPMKKAVDGAITKVEGLSREMSSGKLSRSMDKCAEGIATVADKALDLATDAIPVMINGFAFIVDHGKEVVTVTAAIATGMMYYSNQQKIANAITIASAAAQKVYAAGSLVMETATSLLTGKITLQTAAQEALNLVQMASPQGLLTAAIVAGAAAIGTYIVMSINSKKETDENTKATEKLVDEYEALNETLEENKKTRQESVDAAKAEVGSADIMAQKLDDLSKKENKSNAEKKQMQYYVEELNKIVPDLNLKYDAEKDALNKSTDAIRSNIKAQKDLAIAKAYQENMAAIAKDMADAQIKLDEATQQTTKNEIALKEAKKATRKAYEDYAATGFDAASKEAGAWLKANDAQATAQQNYDKSQKAVEDLKNKMSSLNAEYDKTDQYARKSLDSADLEKKLAEFTALAKKKGREIPEEIANSIREGAYAVPKSVDELGSLIQYDDMIKTAKKNGYDVPKFISDGISSGKLKPAQAVKMMQKEIEFSDMLNQSKAAGTLVPENIRNAVIQGKMKPSDAVHAMESLVEFNKLLNDSKIAGDQVPENIRNAVLNGKMKPADAAQQVQNLVTFQTLLAKSVAAGNDVPENIKQAVMAGKTKPKDAVNQMVSGMVETANAGKPKMKTSGKEISAGFEDGINSKQKSVESAGKNLASSGRSGAKSQSSWFDLGAYAGQGFIDGLSAMTADAMSQAMNFVTSAMNAGKRAQKSRSPSRKWRDEIGMMAGAGYAIGLDNSTGMVEKSAKGLMETAISEAEKYRKMSIPSISLDPIKAVAMSTASGARMQSTAQSFSNAGNNVSFPDKLEIVDKSQNETTLVLQNREVLAKWIAPAVSRELAFLKGR